MSLQQDWRFSEAYYAYLSPRLTRLDRCCLPRRRGRFSKIHIHVDLMESALSLQCPGVRCLGHDSRDKVGTVREWYPDLDVKYENEGTAHRCLLTDYSPQERPKLAARAEACHAWRKKLRRLSELGASL